MICRFRLLKVVPIAVLMSMSGCSRWHGGSSMQVDVEVYKGPLSEEPEIQLSQLDGLLDELGSQTEIFNRLLEKDKQALRSECSEPLTFDCDELEMIFQETKQIADSLKTLRAQGRQCITDRTAWSVKSYLEGISKFAMRLKAKAFYWAENQVVAPAGDPINGPGFLGLEGRITRGVIVSFANLTSEYANQLGSRADALLKQVAGAGGTPQTGLPRQYLPTATYLRDTNPTDFLNLYAWDRAVGLAKTEEWFPNPFYALSNEETVDRVRGFKRLFSDHYWSKINTVYAGGQGQTSIALIRDDIGNWMLKSFENYPKELVEAYWGLTKAGVEGAAELVAVAASGGSGEAVDQLPKVLATVGRLMAGKVTPPASIAASVDVKRLREQTLIKLQALQTEIRAADPVADAAVIQQKLREAANVLGDYEMVVVSLQQAAVPSN